MTIKDFTLINSVSAPMPAVGQLRNRLRILLILLAIALLVSFAGRETTSAAPLLSEDDPLRLAIEGELDEDFLIS